MNPARFPDDVLERMANDPAGSMGWPSRYGRGFAAEVLRLRRELVRVTGEREPPHCPSCDCAALNDQHQIDQDLAKGADRG